MQAAEPHRRLPVGAEAQTSGGVHFRVWAPKHETVEVVVEGKGGPGPAHPEKGIRLVPEKDGYFAGHVPSAGATTRYRYRLGDRLYPDPASRSQPEGPHGPSEVVDPGQFRWTDHAWKGPDRRGQVVYETHIGTLTPEGTWRGAIEVLPRLADLGVTVLEVMPVAEFPGRFGWSYDGVNLFAPTRNYGPPDDMRAFVDRAHALGLAVILDVVYNHLGPDGNHLAEFSPDYFTDCYDCDWGKPINFDGPSSGPVREFFLANAGYWVDEFHLDGLRVDATQAIYDASPRNILEEIVEQVRSAARGRQSLVIGENEPQDTRLLRPVDQGGFGFDALWADDFHHAARVAATGRSEAYYRDYRGSPREFISAAKYGFLYQGQRNSRQGKRRGTPTFGLDPASFVMFLQNHDQVANSAWGDRLHDLTSPGRFRALSALLLLGPGTPMLFQGQEFAASSPFLYFGDHKPEICAAMNQGRLESLAQFPSLKLPWFKDAMAGCADPDTFERSKLDPEEPERGRHARVYAMHRDLIKLRRDDPAFRAQRLGGVDGAVLGAEAFVLRYFHENGGDRLLVVNLGPDLHLEPATEPLLAPPAGARWDTLWSSEDPRYGGTGTPPLDTEEFNWRIPGHAAVALVPVAEEPKPHE